MKIGKLALTAAIAACAIVVMAGCSQQAASSSASASDSGSADSSAASTEASSSSAAAASSSASSGGYTAVLDGNIMAELYLDYSAGTGFEWQCTVDNEGVVGILSQETKSQSDDDTATGGPLRDTIMIAAGNPGTATVTCSLVRPWETDVEPAEVQTFVFEVDETGQLHFNADESNCTIEPEFLTLS